MQVQCVVFEDAGEWMRRIVRHGVVRRCWRRRPRGRRCPARHGGAHVRPRADARRWRSGSIDLFAVERSLLDQRSRQGIEIIAMPQQYRASFMPASSDERRTRLCTRKNQFSKLPLLRAVVGGHPRVGEVHSLGFTAGIQLDGAGVNVLEDRRGVRVSPSRGMRPSIFSIRLVVLASPAKWDLKSGLQHRPP
jgi:hypothetical protein